MIFLVFGIRTYKILETLCIHWCLSSSCHTTVKLFAEDSPIKETDHYTRIAASLEIAKHPQSSIYLRSLLAN